MKSANQNNHSASGGFALVVALSLMAFVVLLLLTITTLVQVEQASASTTLQQMEADQAALLSLHVAIGKLQETAGLDQRVTAPAESVGGVADKSKHLKQLTGVWRSWEGLDHDKTSGLPEAPDYGLKLDQGESEGVTTDTGRFLSWLVSPAFDPTLATGYTASNPPSLLEVIGTTVPLVASGSVGNNLTEQVHLAPTEVIGGGAEIAWWVSGQNTKALIQKAAAEPTDDSEWSQRHASNGRANPEVFDLIDDEQLGRVNSLSHMDLVSTASMSVSQDYFHDVTAYSRGLLTNTANGGWKRDLSLLAEQWWEEWKTGGTQVALPVFTPEPFASAITSSLKLTDDPTDAAIYPWVDEDNVSMSWNALLNFVSMYREVKTNSTSGEPYFDAVATFSSDWVSIMPVLARLHWAFGFDATTTNGTAYTPRLLFKPAVTIWNPFNVAIESVPDSLIHVYNTSFPVDLYATVGGQPETYINLQDMLETRGKSPMMRMVIESDRSADESWKPGESRIFSKPGVSGELAGWAVLYLDPGFSINGGLSKPLSQGAPSIVDGAADDEYTFRWQYRDTGGNATASIQHFWSRDLNSVEGVNLFRQSCEYRMQAPISTIMEKLPLPSLVNDSQTLSGAESEDSPFLAVSIGLRTLVNEDISQTVPKLHTKGYFNTKPIVTGVNLNGNQNPEDSPYAWEVFAPNDWADPFMPQSDDTLAYGDDHSSYVGSSFQSGRGLNRWAIAELPAQPLLSLGELQHFDISFRNQYAPRVANAIGNSHATPHVAKDRVLNTSISTGSYDHCYASNHVFFDDWFVSSITPDVLRYTSNITRDIEEVYEQHLTGEELLRNKHYKPAKILSSVEASTESSELFTDDDAWQVVASKLEVEGLFNINSTSVEAWTAVLMGLKGAEVAYSSVGSNNEDDWNIELDSAADIPVSRTTVAGDLLSASDPDVAQVATYMEMTEVQIEALAEQIVAQIKRRGPFLSLSEFVNRRLDSDEDLALAGAIESALITLSELGSTPGNPYSDIQAAYPQQATLPSDAATVYEFPNAAVGDAAYGTPGWPRQADILRPLAPIMTARDDTFVIRAYGSSQNSVTGETESSSWCEAVVQRRADYVNEANDSREYSNLLAVNKEFGRRFEIISFRWLSQDDI